MIKWTDDMIDELLKAKTVKEFAKKFKISASTAYKVKRELIKKYKIEDKKEKEIEKKEEVVIPKSLEKLNTIILSLDDLIKKGYAFYTQENKNTVASFDKKIIDYLHILEFEYDKLSQKDLSNITYNLTLLRRQRRVYKNELEYLENYKVEAQNFINFMKTIESYNCIVKNKKYITKELKKEDKKISILNVNEEEELRKLTEENKRLKSTLSELSNSSLVERLMKLEKFNLKMTRRLKREKGEVVAIDRLDSNWRNDFNKLDDITRNGILSECYNAYKGLPIKELKDFDVWEKILPEALVQKKYFLKETAHQSLN